MSVATWPTRSVLKDAFFTSSIEQSTCVIDFTSVKFYDRNVKLLLGYFLYIIRTIVCLEPFQIVVKYLYVCMQIQNHYLTFFMIWFASKVDVGTRFLFYRIYTIFSMSFSFSFFFFCVFVFFVFLFFVFCFYNNYLFFGVILYVYLVLFS